MKLKRILALAAATVLALSAVGCSKTNQEPDKIVIGGMGPLTGNNAMYGTAAMNGAKMAIDEYETLLGKPLEFVSLDDKGDTTESVNAYNKLVDNEGAAAIIGAVTSQPSIAVAAAAAKNGTPVISPTGTSPDITDNGENVFRACYIDPFQGQVMATFAGKNLGVKTAAVLYNTDTDYSVGVAEAFKERFEANGGTVVSYEGYSKDNKDFKSQLTNIASNKPEVLFVPDYYNVVALIAKQVKDVNLETILLGADGWDSIASVVEDPTLIEGAYFCNHYAADDPDPLVQDFINKYRETYGIEPNAFAALGYDAAKVMIAAFEQAGTTDPQAVIEALKKTDTGAVTGNLTFDENRNPIKSVSIIQIQNGEYVMYEKINPEDL